MDDNNSRYSGSSNVFRQTADELAGRQYDKDKILISDRDDNSSEIKKTNASTRTESSEKDADTNSEISRKTTASSGYAYTDDKYQASRSRYVSDIIDKEGAENIYDRDDTGTRTSSASAKKSSEPKESFGKAWFREFVGFLKLFVGAFIAAFVITHFVIVNAEVPTGSMTNTIMEHDRLIGFRLSYLFSAPERGDIIIFKYPDDESQNFVKRVIGIPGDVIEISDGKVYVNGEELDEPYIKEPMETYDTLYYIVPEDSYFVMGDNRNNSKDSRYWTTTNYVTKDKIIAKVWFKYFNMQDKKFEFEILK